MPCVFTGWEVVHRDQINFQQLPFKVTPISETASLFFPQGKWLPTVHASGSWGRFFTWLEHGRSQPKTARSLIRFPAHYFFLSWQMYSAWLNFCTRYSIIHQKSQLCTSDYGGQCNFIFNLNSRGGPGDDIWWKLMINSASHWVVLYVSS